jgi:nucleotide-binding universal stress UspA family protein
VKKIPRILLAIDGSERSFAAACYLGKVISKQSESLSSEILTYQKSRAAAIAKAARDGGCDTIVLGRRGFTSVGEFKLGRVSRKILHYAFHPALWIVNGEC